MMAYDLLAVVFVVSTVVMVGGLVILGWQDWQEGCKR